MKRIFIDTWAWVALLDRQDRNHEKAGQMNDKLLDDGYFFVTSNFVFGEALTALRYRVGYEESLHFREVFTQLIKGRLLKVWRVTEAIEDQAWQIFTKYHDQDFSWVDCTSFALMKREKLLEAFTEDHHFRVMGFITHS